MMSFVAHPEQFSHGVTGQPFGAAFGIAFNFHSYARYVNLPYSCRVHEETALKDVVKDVARRCTRWNHWDYGHSFERVRASAA
jgi:hypothetical protein